MVACRVVAKEDGWYFVLTVLGHVRSGSEDSFVPVEFNVTEVGDLTVASQRSMSVGISLNRGPQAVLGQFQPPVHATLLQAPEKGVSSNRDSGP